MNEQIIKMLLDGIKDTLYMTFGSVIIGYIIGLPLGILLCVTGKNGLRPNALIYRVGDFLCNILFIINIHVVTTILLFNIAYFIDPFYKSSGWKELWLYSNNSASCYMLCAIYC